MTQSEVGTLLDVLSCSERGNKFQLIDPQFDGTNIKNYKETAKQDFPLTMTNPTDFKSNIAILNVANIINMIVKKWLWEGSGYIKQSAFKQSSIR